RHTRFSRDWSSDVCSSDLRKAHLILPTHQLLDAASESKMGDAKIGSTLKGIGPTYMDKTGRNGLRIGDTTLPDFQARYNKLVEKHKSILSHYGDIPDFSEKIGRASC